MRSSEMQQTQKMKEQDKKQTFIPKNMASLSVGYIQTNFWTSVFEKGSNEPSSNIEVDQSPAARLPSYPQSIFISTGLRTSK